MPTELIIMSSATLASVIVPWSSLIYPAYRALQQNYLALCLHFSSLPWRLFLHEHRTAPSHRHTSSEAHTLWPRASLPFRDFNGYLLAVQSCAQGELLWRTGSVTPKHSNLNKFGILFAWWGSCGSPQCGVDTSSDSGSNFWAWAYPAVLLPVPWPLALPQQPLPLNRQ